MDCSRDNEMRKWIPFALTVVLSGPVPAEGPLRLPPDDPPPSVAALMTLDPLGQALAVTISADGSLAAGAFAHPGKGKSSLVRITSQSGVHEIAVRGTIRALQFDSSARVLFALAHRPGKTEPVDAWLVSIDLESGKSDRTVTLPTSAADLDLWIGGGALLVASRDEVRTVLLPQVRTGPLFWIGGENLAVASLAGGDFALVGQESQILLVNLADPQGREQLPVRERVATPSAVDRIAAARDGSGALVRLRDGRTFMLRLDPLRLEALEGTSDVVLWTGRSPGSEPPPEPDEPPTPEPEPVTLETMPAAVPHEVELRPEAQPKAEVEAQPGAEAEPEVEAVETAASADLGELEGIVTGAAAAQVVAVVLLGPDNILREARRIVPRPDGSWDAAALEPGRYRVVLDGGGKHILITEPSFRTVEIEAGVHATAKAIEALRSIDR
jgi:hypothetical protein